MDEEVFEKAKTEENPVSVPPKEEVIESAPVVEEVSESVATAENIPAENLEVEEISQAQNQKVEGIPQAENLSPVEIQEVEPVKPIQTQEIPLQPEIKIVEKIIYKTNPNFIQKLLIKARAKIQERKKKKLDKIMKLFETKTELSNSDIQKLLRTTKRSATRYLDILEKEQKIIQVGNAGRSVKYVRKQ